MYYLGNVVTHVGIYHYYWKCDYLMTWFVRLLVGLLASFSVYPNFLKERKFHFHVPILLKLLTYSGGPMTRQRKKVSKS